MTCPLNFESTGSSPVKQGLPEPGKSFVDQRVSGFAPGVIEGQTPRQGAQLKTSSPGGDHSPSLGSCPASSLGSLPDSPPNPTQTKAAEFIAKFISNVTKARQIGIRLGSEVPEGLTLRDLDCRRTRLFKLRSAFIFCCLLIIPLLVAPFVLSHLNRKMEETDQTIAETQKIYASNAQILNEVKTACSSTGASDRQELDLLIQTMPERLGLVGDWQQNIRDLSIPGTLDRNEHEKEYCLRLHTLAEAYKQEQGIGDLRTLSPEDQEKFLLAMKSKGAFEEYEIAAVYFRDSLLPDFSGISGQMQRFHAEERERRFLIHFIHDVLDGTYAYGKKIKQKTTPIVDRFIREQILPHVSGKRIASLHTCLQQLETLKTEGNPLTPRQAETETSLREKLKAYEGPSDQNPFLEKDWENWIRETSQFMLHNGVIEFYRPLLLELKNEGLLLSKPYPYAASVLREKLGIPPVQVYAALPTL